MKQIVLAVTGASGAIYARRLAQRIVATDAHLHLVVSPHGRRVMKDELAMTEFDAAALLGAAAVNATAYPCGDIGARLASGSFRTEAMVICPCSSNTLAAVAAGTGDNLITRAAHVTLKEGRRLILVPREMPLSQIDLANLLRVSQAGALICPACPGFYLAPRTLDDLVDFVVDRVLDLLGLSRPAAPRWAPAPPE